MTGGRVKRLEAMLGGGNVPGVHVRRRPLRRGSPKAPRVSQIAREKIATVTAVRPPALFGGLVFEGDRVAQVFTEKPQIGEGWINGGFMVFEPKLFSYLSDDTTVLEKDALEALAGDGELTRRIAITIFGSAWTRSAT